MGIYFGDPYWYCRNEDGSINFDVLSESRKFGDPHNSFIPRAEKTFRDPLCQQTEIFESEEEKGNWPFMGYDNSFIIKDTATARRERLREVLYDAEREKNPEKQADIILGAAKDIDGAANDPVAQELIRKITEIIDRLGKY